MTTLLFWLLGLYCLGSTLLIMVIQHRRAVQSNIASKIESLSLDGFTPKERLEAIAAITTLKGAESAWYEKSLSVIGVVAFFSMLIATGLQTLNGSVAAAQADQLRKEIAALEDARSKTDALLAIISRSVMEQARVSGRIDKASEEVLRNRLERLRNILKPDREELTELFDVALLTGDLETAKECIDRNENLLDRTKPENLLRLAEYEVIEGTPLAAKEYLKHLKDQMDQLPVAWQIRMIIVDTAVNGNLDGGSEELAALLRTDKEEAKRRLTVDMEKLQSRPLRRKSKKPTH